MSHRDEEAAHANNGEVDLLLADQIAEAEAEAWDEFEICPLQAELCESFEPFELVEADEEIGRSYTLSPVPREVQKEIDSFRDFRLKKLNRHRRGAHVQVRARTSFPVTHAPLAPPRPLPCA